MNVVPTCTSSTTFVCHLNAVVQCGHIAIRFRSVREGKIMVAMEMFESILFTNDDDEPFEFPALRKLAKMSIKIRNAQNLNRMSIAAFINHPIQSANR